MFQWGLFASKLSNINKLSKTSLRQKNFPVLIGQAKDSYATKKSPVLYPGD
jgi:hypothetical protein